MHAAGGETAGIATGMTASPEGTAADGCWPLFRTGIAVAASGLLIVMLLLPVSGEAVDLIGNKPQSD